MDADTNYWLIWIVYLAAAGVFYPIFWKVTRFRWRWLGYSLRGLMAALIFTPWYANDQLNVLAPALMVAALDAITIGAEAASRASVPLVLALLTAEILATIIWLVHRKRKSAAKTRA